MNWHDYFVYDEAGKLIWKSRPPEHFKSMVAWMVWNTKFVGKVAGHVRPDGYTNVGIGGKLYLAHRIILEMHDGPMLPRQEVDHIDMDKTNNRRHNLRRCSASQNRVNVGLNRTNKSGFKGVSWNKPMGKWIANIRINGARKHLGLFMTPEEAHVAYYAASIEHHGEFARTG